MWQLDIENMRLPEDQSILGHEALCVSWLHTLCQQTIVMLLLKEIQRKTVFRINWLIHDSNSKEGELSQESIPTYPTHCWSTSAANQETLESPAKKMSSQEISAYLIKCHNNVPVCVKILN